jgi:hypothetical protein
MLANGTPRRVIETMQKFGVSSSYTHLNEMFTAMKKQAAKDNKRAAHDPNSFIVYDNFNFLEKPRDLAGGKRPVMQNLITTILLLQYSHSVRSLVA